MGAGVGGSRATGAGRCGCVVTSAVVYKRIGQFSMAIDP